MKKSEVKKFNEYVDFEYRCILAEFCNVAINRPMRGMSGYFRQLGKRLGEVRGFNPDAKKQMIELTQSLTPRNLFEFGKLLVDNFEHSSLTMQQVLGMESEYFARNAR